MQNTQCNTHWYSSKVGLSTMKHKTVTDMSEAFRRTKRREMGIVMESGAEEFMHDHGDILHGLPADLLMSSVLRMNKCYMISQQKNKTQVTTDY